MSLLSGLRLNRHQIALCGRQADWQPALIRDGDQYHVCFPVLPNGRGIIPYSWAEDYGFVQAFLNRHSQYFELDDVLQGYVTKIDAPDTFVEMYESGLGR